MGARAQRALVLRKFEQPRRVDTMQRFHMFSCPPRRKRGMSTRYIHNEQPLREEIDREALQKCRITQCRYGHLRGDIDAVYAPREIFYSLLQPPWAWYIAPEVTWQPFRGSVSLILSFTDLNVNATQPLRPFVFLVQFT